MYGIPFVRIISPAQAAHPCNDVVISFQPPIAVVWYFKLIDINQIRSFHPPGVFPWVTCISVGHLLLALGWGEIASGWDDPSDIKVVG